MKVLIALFLSLTLFQTTHQSDRVNDGFVGPVRKVAVVWTPVSGGDYPQGSKCRQLTDEYDETGRLTRHSVYPGSCGSDEIREDYTYAADGSRGVKRQEIRAPGSAPPPAIGGTSNASTGPPKEIIKHDSAGRLIEKSWVKPDGGFSYRTLFSYDDKGRLTEMSGYDGTGHLVVKRAYSYAAEQRAPSSFIYYGPSGKVSERTSYTDYEYNSNGDWIKRKQTIDEGSNRGKVSITSREIEYYSPK